MLYTFHLSERVSGNVGAYLTRLWLIGTSSPLVEAPCPKFCSRRSPGSAHMLLVEYADGATVSSATGFQPLIETFPRIACPSSAPSMTVSAD